MKPKVFDSPFTFHWPSREVSFVLPGFILLSIFAHALGFYLFQIVYPPSVTITRPPATVALLSPFIEQHRSLDEWVEMEDPAKVLLPHRAVSPLFSQKTYRPQFADFNSALQPVITVAPSQPIILKTTEFSKKTPLPPPPASAFQPTISRVEISPALTQRAITPIAPPTLTPATEPLEPTVFLAGLDKTGQVRYLFLQKSSGNNTVDQTAENHLKTTTFTSSDPDLQWGTITYLWGYDAYQTTK